MGWGVNERHLWVCAKYPTCFIKASVVCLPQCVHVAREPIV